VNAIVADCTVPEKVLLAADQLEKEGQSPFSAESLIVAAWQKFPKTFGLKGYTDQYPDSNKVLSSIMGAKGLATKGYLVKMGQKLYALSREGRQVVKGLQSDGEPKTSAPAEPAMKLSREHEKFLLGLFGTSAFQKLEEGRKQDLTFADACRFWNITENMHGEALNSRLQLLRTQLAEIDHQVSKGHTELSNGRVVTLEDLGQLNDTHDYLLERFARHLSLLRTRSGKQ
jgi:hypothetical protein